MGRCSRRNASRESRCWPSRPRPRTRWSSAPRRGPRSGASGGSCHTTSSAAATPARWSASTPALAASCAPTAATLAATPPRRACAVVCAARSAAEHGTARVAWRRSWVYRAHVHLCMHVCGVPPCTWRPCRPWRARCAAGWKGPRAGSVLRSLWPLQLGRRRTAGASA